MLQGFTRKDALEISGLSEGELYYLKSAGLVLPQQGSQNTFTAENILDILIVRRLKKRLKSPRLLQVLRHLRANGYDTRLFRMEMVFSGDSILWNDVEDPFSGAIVEGLHKNRRMNCLIEPLGDVTAALWDRKYPIGVLDFNKRIEGTVLSRIRDDFQKNPMPEEVPDSEWTDIQLAHAMTQKSRGVKVTDLKPLTREQVMGIWKETKPRENLNEIERESPILEDGEG